MSQFSIAGKWRGFYVYGEGYSDHYFGTRVMFELELHDTGNEEFEGTCTDLDDKPSSPTTIKGYIDDQFISFVKEYSAPVTTPEISYSGYYNPLQETFFGEWEHLGEILETAEGAFIGGGAGIWKMKKV
ncbi:hypothetical protein [Chitinophaga qingshengii]|uniref:YopX protein domain-containing protein n=1 Tax=Chitinophaga qingshengii TaxID=1569794 RepID=A0ABR7TXZ5_9BACT|nr:hypothetical protein [Chitinophaga qingshengii]MBC9934953.1 hypothetical protein [Chitinophaga qingshengii]